MSRLRLTVANALPVTIRPPFEPRAKAAIARSISPASRTLTGFSSTPNDGATDCIAPNWPAPTARRGSQMTATRLTPGCDLFEQFEPFRADANFEAHKPGGVAARPRQAFNQTGSDRIGGGRKHDRHCAGQSQQGSHR